MNKQEIEKERNQIIAQIKEHVPLMRSFFELGDTVRDYSRSLYRFETHPTHKKRQELIKEKIRTKFSMLFGENAMKEMGISFPENLAFNIVDHHQVLNNPLLISSNFIGSVDKFFADEKQDAIVVVSSGDVPPNNYFSKGGFQFHDKRVPVFSVKEREMSTFYIPKREFDFVARLKNIKRWHEFSPDEQGFLRDEENRLNSLDFSRCLDYKDQISVVVKNTWPLLYENSMRSRVPELLYVTQEELTSQCLQVLLKKEDNFLSRIIDDINFRKSILDNFRGIVVAWNEQENKGTHFFWRKYPGEARSLRMYIDGDRLVPADQRFQTLSVPLERKAIVEHLESGEIYPSLFMIFTTLIFYAGIKPLAGYGSRVYLEYFKEAWIKTLEDTDMRSEIDLIKTVDTSQFVGGLALFFERQDKIIKTLYARDIIYDGGIKEEYLKTAANMKFSELIGVAVADMYDYYASKYIPENKRLKPTIGFDELASITFDWIK